MFAACKEAMKIPEAEFNKLSVVKTLVKTTAVAYIHKTGWKSLKDP